LEEARNLVRIRHVADPGTPCCVDQAVPETDEDEHDDEHWIRRMERENDVRGEVACWTDNRYSSLAEFDVHHVIDSRRNRISRKRGQED
jgi:hypothetical protein